MAKHSSVSMSVRRRLPRYYRYLGDLITKGVERISSREFADIIGHTASQIRQDLNCFGGFGQQGYGYNVSTLYAEIGRILAVDKQLPTVLIGVGHLGHALVTNMGFHKFGFNLMAIFDNSSQTIGQVVNGLPVWDVADLEAFCAQNKPLAAVLCVPRSAAMEICDILIRHGVKGFWNFSHYDLSLAYKEGIAVENVQLGDSLMTLSYCINELTEE